ncbi:PP2C family protein-serine/threonine phosphatase [Colwellia piezophila]|uniref:PP2C family protein-serine/threonine phosphatase n=1 Tax=Colwellia piezophila TaxID=211668 RepID=UPI0003761FFE|nr:protein phosphatase 2C domain-containing protein [Colwellia piezophila]
MNYQIKSLCHPGAIRDNNEDAISCGVNKELSIVWMLVADGMGGHNAGEVASALLVTHMKQALTGLCKIPAHWSSWISEQFHHANLVIIKQAKKTPAQQGMGTTGILMIVSKNTCHIGWVGDSRAYSLKANVLVQETVDHTMLQELVNQGAITAETARSSKSRNLLSQAIGVRENISVDTQTIAINKGDTLMLSTDGLHDYLTEHDICRYLSEFSINKNLCHDMVNQAMTNSSRDNLTVGLINFN